MTQPPDIEALASGLSEAQRRFIMANSDNPLSISATTYRSKTMTNLEELAARVEGLERFLSSYTEYPESLFGPTVHLAARQFWQKGYWADRDMQRRLKQFGLPKLTAEGRAHFLFSAPQAFDEDAGGFLRRRWAYALGFGSAYKAALRARGEA